MYNILVCIGFICVAIFIPYYVGKFLYHILKDKHDSEDKLEFRQKLEVWSIGAYGVMLVFLIFFVIYLVTY